MFTAEYRRTNAEDFKFDRTNAFLGAAEFPPQPPLRRNNRELLSMSFMT